MIYFSFQILSKSIKIIDGNKLENHDIIFSLCNAPTRNLLKLWLRLWWCPRRRVSDAQDLVAAMPEDEVKPAPPKAKSKKEKQAKVCKFLQTASGEVAPGLPEGIPPFVRIEDAL